MGSRLSSIYDHILCRAGCIHSIIDMYVHSLFFAKLFLIYRVVLRQWVIRDNRKLDEDEKRALTEASRARVEEAARLEGITFDQAMQRRRGFRYLY